MKDKGKLRVLFLLMTCLCIFLLTGCPPRISKEEEERMLSNGRAKLMQAMKEDYQLEEGNFQIVSHKIYWHSAYGYGAVKFELEAGDKTFQVTVSMDTDEVFSDYYGKEFEKTLTDYLEETMESVPKLGEARGCLLSVEYSQPVASNATEGMIPASLSPDDFEAYLEKCRQEKVLNVSLSLAWYGGNAPEPSDNLLSLLSQETGRLTDYVEVNCFDRERNDEMDPMDLKEVRSYYINNDGEYVQYVRLYDYYEVNENVVLRRTLDGDKAGDDHERNKFKVNVDKNGYLTINPENEYYSLYFRGSKEGTKVLYRTKDSKKVYSKEMKTDPFFKNWCCIPSVKGEWEIVLKGWLRN